jgi:hypothetical protein
MVEATHSLPQAPATSQAQRLAQRQAHAVAVLVRRAAIAATKQRLRSQGLKPQHFALREIVALAEARVLADPAHRAKLIAKARPIVDRWTAEGFFGKRAAVQHLQHLHKAGRPEPRALPLCECHDRNGARQ